MSHEARSNDTADILAQVGDTMTQRASPESEAAAALARMREMSAEDRKSTRLNSSHLGISYAVFCLKKKKQDEGRAPACGTLGEDVMRRPTLRSCGWRGYSQANPRRARGCRTADGC